MCVGVSVCMRVCVRECVWCCLPNRPQIYLTLHPISVAWQSVTGVRWNSKQRSCISEFFFTTRICKRVSWCLYMNDLLLWCWMSILLMAGNVSTLIQRIVLFHVLLQMGKNIHSKKASINNTNNEYMNCFTSPQRYSGSHPVFLFGIVNPSFTQLKPTTFIEQIEIKFPYFVTTA